MSAPVTRHASPSPVAGHFVLLHGWGVNSAVWAALIRELDSRTFAPDLFADFSWPADPSAAEPLVRELLERAPARGTWVGWSLGGMLAMLAAHLAPARVARLVLVASTPKFLVSADWEHGAPDRTFAVFAAGLRDDLPATLKRFLLLNAGPGDRARSLAAHTLRAVRERGLPTEAALAAGLDVLAALDLRPRLASLKVPVTVVHGTHDRIAPPGAARALASQIPGARLRLVEGAGHAPFLSHPEVLPALLKHYR